MSRIRIAPIVEGHGECSCIRTLLDRVWREACGGAYTEVLQPVRRPRSKMIKYDRATRRIVLGREEVDRAIRLAAMKLGARADDQTPSLILLMLDADEDCPKEIAELMQEAELHIDPQIGLSTVFPKIEYETWFVAAAPSLTDCLTLHESDADIDDPEAAGCGKSWVEQRFVGGSYSETLDQVKLTARMDLQLCRERSRSFDKLCRELERFRSREPRA